MKQLHNLIRKHGSSIRKMSKVNRIRLFMHDYQKLFLIFVNIIIFSELFSTFILKDKLICIIEFIR